jgi:hypothetical protein
MGRRQGMKNVIIKIQQTKHDGEMVVVLNVKLHMMELNVGQ